MRALPFLLIALVAIAAIPAPSSSQGLDKKLRVVENGAPQINDEGQLNQGRLPPETATVRIVYKFSVVVPPLVVCLDTITVRFTPPASDARATFTLAPAQVTQPFQGEFSGVPATFAAGKTITGFDTVLTVQFTRNAPAFQAQVIPVVAQAIGGLGTLGGCNAVSSDFVVSHTALAADYHPGIEAATPPWKGNTPEPIRVKNFANGLTKVTFAWEREGGNLAPSSTVLRLEAKAFHGPNARDEGDALLDARERPRDWTGRIHVTGTADAECNCKTDVVILVP